MGHSALAGLYIGENKNYSGTGYRKKIDLIVLHHMAGVLTPKQCNDALRSRGGSIHYAIGNDGVIGYLNSVKIKKVVARCFGSRLGN